MSTSPPPISPPRPAWVLKPIGKTTGSGDTLAGMEPLVQRLLRQRGYITDEAIQTFLHPKLAGLGDPFVLPEMDLAVQRIFEAVDRNEIVVLYGDYDVDGVTSMAVMHLTLRAYGLDTRFFLPLRMEEGYGISRDGLARLFEENGKPGLLLALDCGTTSLAEMEWIAEQGVDVVIIDHHELSPEGKPKCKALVNPKFGNGGYQYFCTVGLVFKVAHALLKTRKLEPDVFDLRETLDLAALGTVADLVPLIDENRIIVRRGLELITNTQRPGLRALKEVAGLDGIVQTNHLGYRIGPRLNAAGRLDTAETSLNVLLARDHASAMAGAQMLDANNRERQGVEIAAFKEAEAMLIAMGDTTHIPSIVLASRNWHPGVVGIVASRISRMCHRPAICIAIDDQGIGKGSGRSIPGLSLVEAIEPCRHLLRKGGGHAMAIGVSIMEEHIDAFRIAFADIVRATLSNDQLTPTMEIDAELRMSDLNAEFTDQYRLMEPFGMANPEPLFLIRRVTPRLPGRVMKEKHLRVTLRQDGHQHDAIFFNAPLTNMPTTPWDVTVRLQRNWYRGTESWQMTIESIRTAE